MVVNKSAWDYPWTLVMILKTKNQSLPKQITQTLHKMYRVIIQNTKFVYLLRTNIALIKI